MEFEFVVVFFFFFFFAGLSDIRKFGLCFLFCVNFLEFDVRSLRLDNFELNCFIVLESTQHSSELRNGLLRNRVDE